MRIIIELDANESTNLLSQIAGAIPPHAISEAVVSKLQTIVEAVPGPGVPEAGHDGHVWFRIPHRPYGNDFIRVIRTVREATGMGLREGKEFTELGYPVRMPRPTAIALQTELRRIGTSSEILP